MRTCHSCALYWPTTNDFGRPNVPYCLIYGWIEGYEYDKAIECREYAPKGVEDFL